MTNVAHIRLPDETIGQALRSVSALVFDVPNEEGPASHEAFCLHFDSCVMTIRALTDTSELRIDTTNLDIPNDPEFAGCYAIADVSHHQSFRPLIGKLIRNWWSLTNDAGYNDGFMVAFSPNCAVCFIAMNNEVSILHVSGEQCS
jgi:hypothetical protein